MLQILLVLIRRKGASSLNQIIRESGFDKESIIYALYILDSKGKVWSMN